jgi:hypothetical protein
LVIYLGERQRRENKNFQQEMSIYWDPLHADLNTFDNERVMPTKNLSFVDLNPGMKLQDKFY